MHGQRLTSNELSKIWGLGAGKLTGHIQYASLKIQNSAYLQIF